MAVETFQSHVPALSNLDPGMTLPLTFAIAILGLRPTSLPSTK